MLQGPCKLYSQNLIIIMTAVWTVLSPHMRKCCDCVVHGWEGIQMCNSQVYTNRTIQFFAVYLYARMLWVAVATFLFLFSSVITTSTWVYTCRNCCKQQSVCVKCVQCTYFLFGCYCCHMCLEGAFPVNERFTMEYVRTWQSGLLCDSGLCFTE